MDTQRQAGRQCKRPTPFPNGPVFGGELFREDARRLFKQCKAPPNWGEEILWFCIHVADRPERLSIMGALDWGMAQRQMQKPPRGTPDAIMFAELFASAPDIFLKVLSGLRKRMIARKKSPVFKVAQWLLTQDVMVGNDFVWTLKEEDLAAKAKTLLRWDVTAKIIQHARARVRKAQAWKF